MFDFGENWLDYSTRVLTPALADEARRGFAATLAGVPLDGRAFLDIGFGQGLALLCAAEAGARPVGLDINPTCADAFRNSATCFPAVDANAIPLRIGSILDPAVTDGLRALGPEGGYDVVHSWGVLHHTGDMRGALAAATALVRPGGHLVVALYNRHWSSPGWTVVKRAYNAAPPPARRAMVAALTPVIRLAKRLATGQPAARTERGMDFMVDVVDWVGGHPYEYASRDEVAALAAPLGLELVRTVPPRVPTGCNEFVFVRRGQAGEGEGNPSFQR